MTSSVPLSNALADPESEFLRLCHKSLDEAETFLAECKDHARSFNRVFYPGGHGAGVPEQHRIWFDTSVSGSNFGLGCALGPKNQVRFFGLYFFLKPSNFQLANSAQIRFVDFQGNVGLWPLDGPPFTLVSVHRLTPPGQPPVYQDGNCQIARYDSNMKATINKASRNGTSFYKISDDDEISGNKIIWRCFDHEIRYEKDSCSVQKYRSFINDTNSPIIFDHYSFIITEEARLFVDEQLLSKMCNSTFRSALEFVNFIKELCGN